MSLDWPAKYFKPREILSPDGMTLWRRGIMPVRVNLILMLDLLREELGPLIVNGDGNNLRGFRSAEEHLLLVEKGITSNKFSYHYQGLAVDVSSKTYKPEAVCEIARKMGWAYTLQYSTWSHLDLREV